MTSSRLLHALILGAPLAFAACGGEGLTLPPEGAAAHIEVTAGSPQEGRVGAVLATPLEVLVTDTHGRPVAGADVVFTFADGASGGEATPASASTNAEGKAATTLKLGTRAGTIAGTAEVPVEEGVTPVSASFTLSALPADANGIALVSGNPQTGTVNSVLPKPLVVIVTDAAGNPIPNVPIQWTVTGGGSVSATETLTGADGRASVTRTLGPTAGLQSTEASSQVSLGGLTGRVHPYCHCRRSQRSGDSVGRQSKRPGGHCAGAAAGGAGPRCTGQPDCEPARYLGSGRRSGESGDEHHRWAGSCQHYVDRGLDAGRQDR